MANKKPDPGTKAAEGTDAKPKGAEVVADAGHAQAEARSGKGYIGSAPGEHTNDTVAAVTKEA